MKSVLAIFACAAALMLPSAASASILYTSLPDNNLSSPDITGYTGSGEFQLDDNSILNGATLAIWMAPNTPPMTLDWSIQTSANSGILFSGTGATLVNDGPYSVRNGQYSLYYATFTLPDVALNAGDYWLHLSNCGPDGCGWGIKSFSGNDKQYQGSTELSVGKYAFSIQGDVAQAPEPATWLMFVPAIAGFAAVIRRRA
jgi:hypothetical protein